MLLSPHPTRHLAAAIAPSVGGAPRAAFLCRSSQLPQSCFPNPESVSTQEMWGRPSPSQRQGAGNHHGHGARGYSGGESGDQRGFQNPAKENNVLIAEAGPPPSTRPLLGKNEGTLPPPPPRPRDGAARAARPQSWRSAAAVAPAGHSGSPTGHRAHAHTMGIPTAAGRRPACPSLSPWVRGAVPGTPRDTRPPPRAPREANNGGSSAPGNTSQPSPPAKADRSGGGSERRGHPQGARGTLPTRGAPSAQERPPARAAASPHRAGPGP